MLQLNNIRKIYNVGGIETKALDGISVCFKERGLSAVLGTSGSGKTTFLNIVGGLDRYDDGELIIKGKNTKNFRERDWDAYRNNSIGFVFQSYNLITHINIVANVEMGMTLSGVAAAEKRKRAIDLLRRLGLGDHLNKKPNQLSGGQMQRVAIARALANDPEILLCDEPTGALDSTTSLQIMDILREVSQERLVIMVTHNADLAGKYADRIIRFSDGKIISDSSPVKPDEADMNFKLKKTSMSFFTALKLSFNNLATKKMRTFLTSFASSIGIIGIALILSLSGGFQSKIDEYQSDAMAEFPIIISKSAMEVDEDTIKDAQSRMQSVMLGHEEYAEGDEVLLFDPEENSRMHTNVLSDEFIEYLDKINPAICTGIGYMRGTTLNLLRLTNGSAKPVSIASKSASSSMMSGMSGMGLSTYPVSTDPGAENYVQQNYELLAGQYPQSATDIVLVISTTNRLNRSVMTGLGFDTDGVDVIKFSDIVGTELKLIHNDDFYTTTPVGTYLPGSDYDEMYASDKSVTLKITAVVRQKESVDYAMLSSGIAYSDALTDLAISMNTESEIVKTQRDVGYSVLTAEPLTAAAKDSMLTYLGAASEPYMIMVYPNSFDGKDEVLAYIDAYNEGRAEENVILYTDLAETISTMTGAIIDGITIVLIAFAAVSLVVSLIMICIITYTSVLERTKEIGILKALGARKLDITRVFDAETCILGLYSGLMGIGIARLLLIPVNSILYKLTELSGIAVMKLEYALILVVLSTLLTIIGGHIPAKIASKKDAVEALRSE